MSDCDCRRIFGAHAPHLAALLLRSSLTHQRMGSLRSSAQTHDLGHLDTESLAANRNHSSRMALVDDPRPQAANADHYALALIGVDRPGIVASITGALAHLGCNLEDVSTSLLHGHFAMMLEFSAPPGTGFATMREELLTRSAALDLHLEVWPLSDRDAHGAATHVLRVHGPDRLGILAAIAETLAAHGANIREMTCSRVAGDRPAYAVTMEIEVPGPAVSALEADLRQAATGLELRLALEAIEQHVL
jgi:glycine cleavage system transcriptional repressor